MLYARAASSSLQQSNIICMQRAVVNLFSELVHIDQRHAKCVTVSRASDWFRMREKTSEDDEESEIRKMWETKKNLSESIF